MSGTILKHMQTGCDCKSKTQFGGEQIEVREYDEVSTRLARIYSLETTTLVAEGIASYRLGVIDGVKIKNQRWKVIAKSIANGGVPKRSCGFSPSKVELRRVEKVGDTVKIHVHLEHCPDEFIGTEMQVFSKAHHGESGYIPQQGLYGSDKIVVSIINAITRAINYSSILGIYKGDGIESNHFDGIFAQFVWNNKASSKVMEKVAYDFSELKEDKIYARHGGDKKEFADVEGFVSWVKGIKNSKGNALYKVNTKNKTTVEITHTIEAESVAVEVVTGHFVDWSCPSLVEPALIDKRAPFPMVGINRPHKQLTADNILEELAQDKFAWRTELPTDGRSYAGRKAVMIIDPNDYELIDMAVAKANKGAVAFNFGAKAGLSGLGFDIKPLEELKGTGLRLMTFNDNIEIISNVKNENQKIEIGIDKKCGNVWAKHEIFANLIVHDFSECMSNVAGSEFEKKVLLGEPYKPENIPALNPLKR